MSMRLHTVRKVAETASCDILVCENEDDPGLGYLTVIDVKDHKVIQRFLSIYEKANVPQEERNMTYFSAEGKNRVVFPFVRERPLKDFYMGRVLSVEECEEICRNLIMACMTCGLPAPVLYLVLTQGQVHLSADFSVYLSYMIDLTEIDESIGEADCVRVCAEILRDILEVKEKDKAQSYALLQKKTRRASYLTFTELYKDVEIAGVRRRKRNIFALLRYWFEDNKDRLFKVLIVVVTLLLIFTIVTLLTNAIFGDVPWLRLFIRSFEKIGLESLLQ